MANKKLVERYKELHKDNIKVYREATEFLGTRDLPKVKCSLDHLRGNMTEALDIVNKLSK